MSDTIQSAEELAERIMLDNVDFEDETYDIRGAADYIKSDRLALIADIRADEARKQADDVETIRALAKAKDILLKRTYIENDVFIMHALNAALSRLSAPVDVQTRAEAVVRDFCFGTKRLYEDERKELSRLIVEQFMRKG
jgi:hypothetical protein